MIKCVLKTFYADGVDVTESVVKQRVIENLEKFVNAPDGNVISMSVIKAKFSDGVMDDEYRCSYTLDVLLMYAK